MSPLSEDDLFDLFRRTGDPAALAEVFDRTAPDLLRVAQHLSGSAVHGEDLVQATFVAAIEHARDYDPRQRLMPWLVTILNNKARLARRQDARPLDPLRLRREEPEDPICAAQANEATSAVDGALRTLPELYQPVLRLYLRHGLAAAEIADVLQRPPATVRSQLLRGLELLRKALPAGLALGALAAITTGRGLAAVRAAVVARAAVASPVAAPVTFASALSVLAMKKILILLASLAALALGTAGWFVLGAPALVVAEPLPAGPAAASRAGDAPRTAVEPPLVSSATRSAVAEAESVRFARATVRVTYAADGSPAAGEVVVLRPEDGSNRELHERYAVTEANGVATFLDLRPGPASLGSTRAGSKQVALVAGAAVEESLVIPVGFDVRVQVVDTAGRAIPGASVWLSEWGTSTEGQVVGEADAQGRLLLRSVAERRCLAAFAPSFLPCPVQRLHGAKGTEVEARLVLEGPAGEVTGRVLDPEGRPVPYARVQLGYRGDSGTWTGGQEMLSPPTCSLRTDVEGRFRAVGVWCTARLPVFARAAGFAPWKGNVRVEAQRPTELEIRLVRGFTVAGRVTDASGQPCARVTVQDDRMSHQGAWQNTWAGSSEDGAFRLEGLTPGTVTLRADGDDRGRVSTQVEGAEGAVLRWDPVLGAGLSLVGKVTDERGAPLVGWRVQASARGSGRTGTTAADGGFRLPDCIDTAYRVDATDPEDSRQSAGATATGARPGDAPLLLVVPDSRRATARVRGVVDDADGRPVAGAVVWVWDTPRASAPRLETEAGTGRFRSGRMPPGRYVVEISAPGHPPLQLEERVVSPDEELDLGQITLPACGRLLAEVRTAAGDPMAKGFLEIVDLRMPQYTAQRVRIVESAVRSDLLLPGKYVLRGGEAGIGLFQMSFEIRGGEDTRLEAAVRPGLARSFRLVDPTAKAAEPRKAERTVRVVLRWQEAGVATALEERYDYDSLDGIQIQRSIPSGSWKLVAEAASGQRAEVAFTVDAAVPSAPPIEAQWR